MATSSIPMDSSHIIAEHLRSRPLASFHPSPWGDYFLNFVPDDEIIQSEKEKVAKDLEKEVKEQLVQLSTIGDHKSLVELIDAIERLGVAHRFEEEIVSALHSLKHYLAEHQLNLYHTSVCFRLLRQHGLYVSCDVFNKFEDEEGRWFKDCLALDVKGMLSFYESSFVGKHADDILSKARAFTTTHLNSIAAQDPNHPLSQQVSRALYQPMFRGMPRLEARLFISYYEKDPCHNKKLLMLAKMDFNLIQTLHKKELKDLTRFHHD